MMSELRDHTRTRMIVGLAGVAITCIALLSLFGIMLGIKILYEWADVGMALNTSICFILVGVSFITLSLNERVWK